MDPNVSTLEQVFASLPGADDPEDVYASAAAVAEATGLSKSTVNARLAELRDAGRVVSTDDATPLYRQTMETTDLRAEADAAGEAAETSQDQGDWPPTSEPPIEDAESTTVDGGAPPPAPKKRTPKKAAKKAAPKAAKKAAPKKTDKTTKKAAAQDTVRARVGTRKFGAGLQDAVLSHVQTDPEKSWGIYEVAKALHAYPTSVGYALKRLLVKGNVTQVQDQPPRYKAA